MMDDANRIRSVNIYHYYQRILGFTFFAKDKNSSGRLAGSSQGIL
jgi:hypothetical protein